MVRAILPVIVAVPLCLACHKPRKIEPEHITQKGSENNKSRKKPSPRPDIKLPSPPTSVPEEDLPFDAVETAANLPSGPNPQSVEEKLKKLKLKAQQELLWARDLISNIPSYKTRLERFETQFDEWGMYRKVPLVPDESGLRAAIQKAAAGSGVVITFLEIREADTPAEPIPPTIHGDRSFNFHVNQIRGVLIVTVKVEIHTMGETERFVEALKQAERLIAIRKVDLLGNAAVVHAEAYWFKEERYPIHIIEEKDLEREMHNSGLDLSVEEAVKLDPIGHLHSAALSYREYNASLEKINEGMRLLSRIRFLSARSSFFRKKAEEAAGGMAR